MSRQTRGLGVGIGLAAAMLGSRAFAEPPALVNAFAQSLVRQCGGTLTPALASQVVQQIDLNGDKTPDWVVDASRYPCPSRPAAFADQGSVVMLFAGRPDGQALPALQKMAFATRVEGRPETGYALWITLGGLDCGDENPKARCDRRVIWQAAGHRFDLAELSPKPKSPNPPAPTRK